MGKVKECERIFIDGKKKCSHCGDFKEPELFSLFKDSRTMKSHRRSYCRVCEYKKNDKYKDRPYKLYAVKQAVLNAPKTYKENRERILRTAKARYYKNIDSKRYKSRVQAKKDRQKMPDHYIINRLSWQLKIPVASIRQLPNLDEIIKLKRIHLLFTRKISTNEK